jgi:hypothetical protein
MRNIKLFIAHSLPCTCREYYLYRGLDDPDCLRHVALIDLMADTSAAFLNWATSEGWTRLPGDPPRYFRTGSEPMEASAEEVYKLFQNGENQPQ